MKAHREADEPLASLPQLLAMDPAGGSFRGKRCIEQHLGFLDR